jgi:hypothetical protein
MITMVWTFKKHGQNKVNKKGIRFKMCGKETYEWQRARELSQAEEDINKEDGAEFSVGCLMRLSVSRLWCQMVE